MSPFLQTALEAAYAAQEIILHYYHGKFAVEIKADQSPVTIADLEAEQAIKKIILERFPEHGFFGEETGKTNPDAEYTWLIDPIDGTKSFVRRYPMFSTQIALMKGSELILGVSNAPAFNEMAYAEQGQGAYLNQQPIKVSGYTEINQSALSLGNIASLAASASWGNLGKLITQVQRIRGYGDFLHYHLLASGKVDMIVESDVNVLDIAALSVIVNEAGGVFTDLQGKPLSLSSTTVLAAASKELHQQLLQSLNYQTA
ncbi:inositol monophosphatase family protein [uncultured Thiothrix sp.]|uniref:inositol monophosphatase family protein n=1 Tax=uncultured Thiothrix sp. TaxID=223185 RepID=UPI002625CC48|nr:inositol monophosphatase family protein [uncultured Thiothrix sp.]HMT92293.1 inositol monophosphatase family protein [Thiolinea sp.]